MEKTFKIVNGDISDGYHTFDELYEHRVAIYLALIAPYAKYAWYKIDVDYPGWFCVYLELPDTGQISYHIPDKHLKIIQALGIQEQPEGKKYDGHNSAQVVSRLAIHTNRYCQWRTNP